MTGLDGQAYWRTSKIVDAYDNQVVYRYGTSGEANRKLECIEYPDGVDELYDYQPSWILSGVWSDGNFSGIETRRVVRATGELIAKRCLLFRKRGPTWARPYKGDLLYRIYHEERRILPDLTSPGASETYSIPAGLLAPLRSQVIEYDYVPGTPLLRSVKQFTCDGVSGSNPSSVRECVRYEYAALGGRARVTREVQLQKSLVLDFSYSFHPGGVGGEQPVETITCTDQDGGVTVRSLDASQRIISETMFPATSSGTASRATDPDAGQDTEPSSITIDYEYSYATSIPSCSCADRPSAVVNRTSGRRIDYLYDTTTGLLLQASLPNPSGSATAAMSQASYAPSVAGDVHGAYKLLSETDASGVVTTYTYTSVPRPNGWGVKHQAIKRTSPPVAVAGGGSPLSIEYTEMHDVSAPVLNQGKQSRLVGQVLRTVDGDSVVTDMAYDNAGRPASVVVNPGGGPLELVTATTFDAKGSLVSLTRNAGSALASTVAIENDPAGRPARVWSTVNGVLHETRYYYDRWDNLCVVLRRNKSSAGAQPDDMGPSPRTDVARDWLQDEFHYDGQRLVVALQDRRSLDRNSNGPLADDPNGDGRFLRTVYLQSPSGRLLEVGCSNGSVKRFTYDGYGSLYRAEHTAPGQPSLVARYFVNSSLEVVRRLDGSGTQVSSTRFDRNGAGVVARITEPTTAVPVGYPAGWSTASAVQEFTTDVLGRTTESRTYAAPVGATSVLLRKRTTYDEIGRPRLLEVFEGAAATASQIYTLHWKGVTRLERIAGPGGRFVAQQFDVLARVSQRWDCRDAANPNKMLYEFEGGTNFVKRAKAIAWDEASSPGASVERTTEFVRDALGRVLQAKWFGTSGTPLVHSFTYYTAGQTESYTGPDGKIEKYLPDALGRLAERYRPQGTAIWNETRYLDWTGIDSRTETRQVDGLGHETRTVFDFAGRPIIVMEPGSVVAPTGAAPYQPFARLLQYDNLSRLTDVYAGDETRVHFERDAAGRVIGRHVANGNAHVSGYYGGDWIERNALGQITRTQSNLGAGLGAYVQEEFLRDALGRTHRESFQYLFTPTWTNIESTYGTVGDTVRTGLTYDNSLWIGMVPDAVGHLQSLSWRTTQAGASTPLASYFHEGDAIRRRQTSYPLGASSPGSFTTDYSYDPYGRMSGIGHSFSAAASVAFHYDAASNLVREVYEKQGLPSITGEGDRFAYDEHNRLLKAWLGSDAATLSSPNPDAGNFVKRLTYGLDAANNRTNVETLDGGSSTPSNEDYVLQQTPGSQGPSNRYESVGGVEVWHDDRGNMIFDGRNHYFVYDALNRLTEVWAIRSSGQQMGSGGSSSLMSGSTSASLEGSAEGGGSSAPPPTETEPYVVTDIGALRQARTAVMGRVGSNLLAVLASNQQTPMASQLREPLSPGSVQPLSGASAGSTSMLSPGIVQGGMASTMAPSPESLDLELQAIYLYDYAHRRVVRWLLADSMYYYAYDDWEEVQEAKLGVGAVRQCVWGEQLDELVAFRVKDGAMWNSYYVAEGGAHCPSRVLDAGGGLAEIQEYDPYGRTTFFRGSGSNLGDVSAIGNPFGWKGHRIDPETGFLYMRHRYFAPRQGRFASQDPLGVWFDETAFGNGYCYGASNPLAFGDPFGLQVVNFSGGRYITDKKSFTDAQVRELAGIMDRRQFDKKHDEMLRGNWGPEGLSGQKKKIQAQLDEPLKVAVELAAGVATGGASVALIGAEATAVAAFTLAAGAFTIGANAAAQAKTDEEFAQARGLVNQGVIGMPLAVVAAALPCPGETVTVAKMRDDYVPLPSTPAARGGSRAPDFVVTPGGEAIRVPTSATGPTPTRAPGFQYTGGSGGHGLDSRVSGVRIMEGNANQGPRAVYMNSSGQTVNPATGRTVPNADPNAHHYLNPWE